MRIDENISVDQYHTARASPMLSRLAIRSRPSATDRVCKRLRRLVRRVISFRPRLSASLTKSFQTCIATLAQPLKYGRYVIIKCQGRPHASRHKMIDVLMSRPVMRFWAPERSDAGPAKGIDKSLLALAAPRRYRSREHLRYVMQQPCLVCGRKPFDPHHLRYMQPRALGRKASDEFAVPLCRGHHRELHRARDERAWWKQAGIDPIKVARGLWKDTRKDEGHAPPEAITQTPQPGLALNSQPIGSPGPDIG